MRLSPETFAAAMRLIAEAFLDENGPGHWRPGESGTMDIPLVAIAEDAYLEALKGRYPEMFTQKKFPR